MISDIFIILEKDFAAFIPGVEIDFKAKHQISNRKGICNNIKLVCHITRPVQCKTVKTDIELELLLFFLINCALLAFKEDIM